MLQTHLLERHLDAEEFYAKRDFKPIVILKSEYKAVLMFFGLMGFA